MLDGDYARSTWLDMPTRIRLLTALLGTLTVLLIPRAAPAQADSGSMRHDVGSWMTITAGGPLGATETRLSWSGMGQVRAVENSGGYHIGVVSGSLGYKVSPQTSVGLAGFIYHIDPSNVDDFYERRLSQQLVWTRSGSPVTLTLRGRVEQRFFTTGDDVGLRVRALLRLRAPLSDDTRFGVEGYQESFISLRDTDWGATSGYRQNRVYVGAWWWLNSTESVKLSAGYLNQTGFRSQARDLMNHLLAVQLAVRL